MKKVGVLLMNLGTPDTATKEAVAVYLREFLMDPFTIDLPYLIRWPLVNLIITPRRAAKSAHAYQQIWTAEGSPLRFQTAKQTQLLGQALAQSGVQVAFAMRYGNPSVASVLEKFQSESISELVVLPLYPQQAGATTETAIAHVNAEMRKFPRLQKVQFIESFFHDRRFHQLAAKMYADHLPALSDYHLLFSFHGLPIRQLKKADASGKCCYEKANCCAQITAENRRCYKAQCLANARGILQELEAGYPAGIQSSICFQSRLGLADWIQPYAEAHVQQLAQQGVKKIAVSSLSFVTDCLENLEEIEIRLKQVFLSAGGQEFVLLPSFNSHPLWIDYLRELIQQRIS